MLLNTTLPVTSGLQIVCPHLLSMILGLITYALVDGIPAQVLATHEKKRCSQPELGPLSLRVYFNVMYVLGHPLPLS